MQPRLIRPPPTQHMKELYPTEARLYEQVIAHGLPNYLGAKITLDTEFPLQLWEQELSDYNDKQLTMFLQYGWPTSYMGPSIPALGVPNHHSAVVQHQAVTNFIQKEMNLNGLMGPFKAPPSTGLGQTRSWHGPKGNQGSIGSSWI